MESSATSTRSRLPAPARAAVEDLLERLDRAAPGRVEGFYVVGSGCLGAFRHGRSDVDFVAIVDRDLNRAELARLRTIHLGRWGAALIRDVALGRRWPLVCNGTYLEQGALARSPRAVTPVAGHVAGHFGVADRGRFDVNPVTWHILARHGIAIRGPDPHELEIWTDATELRAWTIENLDEYWRPWAERARRPGWRTRRFAAAGVLGVSRLPFTLATGEIATKEAAGEYALKAFGAHWRPAVEDALAYWRGGPPARSYRRRPALRIRQAAAYVDYVADLTARSV